jgi:flagellar protein FlaG
MSSETFTTAMFLITSIIAAGVLINAVFPVVYQMAGTFLSSSHQSDERMRTDIKIVNTYMSSTGSAQIWIKNVGVARIAYAEIPKSDLFLGAVGNFDRLEYNTTLANDQWYYETAGGDSNNYWDPGETIEVVALTDNGGPFSRGMPVYAQFVLPSGVLRSLEFTVS